MEQNTRQKICAITGRRPDGFPWEYGNNAHTRAYLHNLKDVLCRLLEEEKVTCFITGGALGIDLDAAEIILQLKEEYPFLTHILTLPYENQGGRYGLKDKIRHEKVQKSSSVVCLSDHYTPWCMQQRNEYMVDNADLVAAFYSGEKSGGTYNTIRYAKRKNKPVLSFDLSGSQEKNWHPTKEAEQLNLY